MFVILLFFGGLGILWISRVALVMLLSRWTHILLVEFHGLLLQGGTPRRARRERLFSRGVSVAIHFVEIYFRVYLRDL